MNLEPTTYFRLQARHKPNAGHWKSTVVVGVESVRPSEKVSEPKPNSFTLLLDLKVKVRVQIRTF